MSKRALVTGGNRGIGLAITRQLAEAGFETLLGARALSEGERAAASIDGASAVELDVTDGASIDALTAAVGELEVLVNNAGVALDGFDAEVVRRTLAVNLYGVKRVTDAMLPALGHRGRIVMVSSGVGELDGIGSPWREKFAAVASFEGLDALCRQFVGDVEAGEHDARGWPSSAYKISKVALGALTRIYAADLESDERELTVNAMCPGWVRTDMGGSSAPRSPEEGADTALWLCTREQRSGGGFYRDRSSISW
ncbi:MAG: SDR family NAD(P)-dependent oxidoreductase [Deltaproteobacteria bacterium]|nr:SDR family NAD(P)-dependent oxidoreductase [Deltaproteobacteria bacterium]